MWHLEYPRVLKTFDGGQLQEFVTQRTILFSCVCRGSVSNDLHTFSIKFILHKVYFFFIKYTFIKTLEIHNFSSNFSHTISKLLDIFEHICNDFICLYVSLVEREVNGQINKKRNFVVFTQDIYNFLYLKWKIITHVLSNEPFFLQEEEVLGKP